MASVVFLRESLEELFRLAHTPIGEDLEPLLPLANCISAELANRTGQPDRFPPQLIRKLLCCTVEEWHAWLDMVTCPAQD
jgi:hypothetical protein